ncbi:MAG: carboxy terminal-processing peptidase [Bacteroidales bacterium]|jgi:carboxyl-terminal processing protease|nr:carboxy terminal-processing peptidase [Bacteroidales bacterium]
MTKRLFLFPFFLTLLLSFYSCCGQSQQDIKRNVYLEKLIQEGIRQEHFQPIPVDDEFSEKAFDEYLKKLDYNKRFFVQSDVDALSAYRHEIDDQYLNMQFDFYYFSLDLIRERIKEAETYCFDLLGKPFDFKTDEDIQFNSDSIDWAKTKEELQDRWRKTLKYEILTRLHTKMTDQEKAAKKSDTVTIKTFAQLEKEARESVGKRYKDWLSYLIQNDDNDYIALYINSILNVYDPHTEYFPPQDKENFDIRLSGQLQGIGATLSQKDGYITVVDIVVGSPSWKQGELEVDDKILKVAQGEEEPMDIVDMRLDKAIRFIRGPKGTEVRLTVQKVDGSQKVIPIIRDVVVIEDTYAKSMILTDTETNAKIGYIYLPSFYVNFQDKDARRSSVDMKNEIEKVKAEGISGIIFDLRNNTGGSLIDCVDIAGLFIDQGPVVQVKGKVGAPQVLSDKVPGANWDGPLVVLVNNYSASASEIFAAAMQDYERAVILGSTTYGKGTVQRFEDLDRVVRGLSEIKPLGSIKFTTSKYYRINGGSTQLKGVIPNVSAPTAFKYINTGERELDNALTWTEIDPTKYETWKKGSCKWDDVIKKSQERIEKNNYFTMMDENAQRLKNRRDETIYPLNYDAFSALLKTHEEETERFKDLGKDTLNIVAKIITQDEGTVPNDTATIEKNKRWNKNIITDNTLYEAMKVVQDIQKLKCFAIKED